MYQLNKLDKEQAAESQQNEGSHIKIRVEICKRLKKKLVENINETKSWSFETVTEIDMISLIMIKNNQKLISLGGLRKNENKQGNKNKNEREVSTYREYYELYAPRKLENLKEVVEFLEIYNL